MVFFASFVQNIHHFRDEALRDQNPPPERIVIEASGVSRPLAILEAVTDDAFADRLVVDATICLVDADQFPDLDYAATELAIDQAGSSDLLVLNKCDLASPEAIRATETSLAGPNPSIRQIRTQHANVDRAILLGPDLGPKVAGGGKAGAAHAEHHDHDHPDCCDPDCGHPHHTHHADAFETWHWSAARPLDIAALANLRRHLPTPLLRAKGIVSVLRDGKPARAVFQVVGKRATVTLEDGAAPDESRIVFIAHSGGLAREAIAAALAGCVTT